MNAQRAFLRRDGDRYFPNDVAVGPWGPTTMSGLVVSGLVGQVAEQRAGGDGFRAARLTVDMIRMATLDELTVRGELIREGRRLRLADVVIEQNGRDVARGRAVFVRGGETPAGEVWSDPVTMPLPPPDESWQAGPRVFAEGDATPAADFSPWEDPSRRKYMWWRLDRDVVEGEPMSGFVLAACVADATNPLTNWGSTGLGFVNADVSLTLAREPQGLLIGLAARDRQVEGGVSVGTATMHDASGPIGTCVVTSLASEVPMQPPNR